MLQRSNQPDKPTIENGVVAEAVDTVDVGGTYTVTCSDGFTLSPVGDGVMTCDAGGDFDVTVACEGGTVLIQF